MLRIVSPDAASAISRRTIFGKIYNHEARRRDRIMPTLSPYMKRYGEMPRGFRAYNTPPIVSVNIGYGGQFAIADQIPIPRPLPWERIIK